MQNDDRDAFEPEVQPRAEVIALVRYTITPEDIAKTTADYAALSADTPAGYEQVRKAIGYCRTTRVEVETQRKAKKAGALEFGRKVDAGAKALVALIDPIETELQRKKDTVDAERERIKREAAEAERAAIEAKVRAEREAEEARIKAERDAEEARLRAEREAEEQRLTAQRAEMAAERQKLEAERAALERQQRELADARAQAEREEAVRLAKIEAEREAAARAERERIAAEERRVAEAERQASLARRIEALKPDLDKVRDFAAAIRALSAPIVTTEEAKTQITCALDDLGDIANGLDLFASSARHVTAAE